MFLPDTVRNVRKVCFIPMRGTKRPGDFSTFTEVSQDENKVCFIINTPEILGEGGKKKINLFPDFQMFLNRRGNHGWTWSITEQMRDKDHSSLKKKTQGLKTSLKGALQRKLLCLACQWSCEPSERHIHRLCCTSTFLWSLMVAMTIRRVCPRQSASARPATETSVALHVLQKPHRFMKDFVQSWRTVRKPGVSIDL